MPKIYKQNMKKFLIFLLIFILFIFPAMASKGIYLQGKQINLNVPCINNQSSCSMAATCNITIENPNSMVIINQAPMQNNLNYFNYTLTSNLTNETGTYNSLMYCDDNGFKGYSLFNFDVVSCCCLI